MAIQIAAGNTTSVAANSDSAEQITGVNALGGKGRYTLIAKASAVGMRARLFVGLTPLINDTVIPYFGATGSLSQNDNVVVSQVVNGGYVSLIWSNRTAGAVTVDYQLLFEPTK